MNTKGIFMKETDHWATPKTIYNHYMQLGYFDPCPLHCELFDGLHIDWQEKNFVNPPYSRCAEWVDKAIIEHSKGRHVIMLLPARTDTKWFHKLLNTPNVNIEFVKGRLKFGDSKNSAPFPSVYIKMI